MKDRKPPKKPRPPAGGRGGGGGGDKKKHGPRLGRDAQEKIGLQLRKVFDDIISQGVPDRFVDLLKRLDKPKDSDLR